MSTRWNTPSCSPSGFSATMCFSPSANARPVTLHLPWPRLILNSDISLALQVHFQCLGNLAGVAEAAYPAIRDFAQRAEGRHLMKVIQLPQPDDWPDALNGAQFAEGLYQVLVKDKPGVVSG